LWWWWWWRHKFDVTMNDPKHRQTYFTGISSIEFQSRKRKLLKLISSQHLAIKMYPSVITIAEYESGMCQNITVTIRNMSNSSKTIALVCKSPCLEFVDRVPLDAFTLAPGFRTEFTLQFLHLLATHEPIDISEALKFETDDGHVLSASIHVQPRTSYLNFDPLLDFGNIFYFNQQANEPTCSRKIIINALGNQAITVLLSSNLHTVKIEPSKFELVPASSVTKILVNISIFGHNDINDFIDLLITGPMGIQKAKITLKACFLGSRVKLYTKDGANLDSICFAPTFFGEKICHEARITNESSQKLSWILSKTNPTRPKTLQSHQNILQVLKTLEPKSVVEDISFEPREGVLNANESTLVKFHFQPRIVSVKGFTCLNSLDYSKSYQETVSMQILDSLNDDIFTAQMSDPVSFAVTASANMLAVTLSPRELIFEESGEHMIELENHSTSKHVKFEFESLCHFCIEPPSGKIKPGSKITAKIVFRPSQLGIFNSNLSCLIYGNCKKTPLKTLNVTILAQKLPVSILHSQ
jgi:hypothetical protein